jgi:hypothetical protein
MPRFTVHVDQDDLARQDLAAALTRRPATDRPERGAAAAIPHHGARDSRQPVRDRAREAGAKGRSYAFRRS